LAERTVREAVWRLIEGEALDVTWDMKLITREDAALEAS
jgi:hypothetical protein